MKFRLAATLLGSLTLAIAPTAAHADQLNLFPFLSQAQQQLNLTPYQETQIRQINRQFDNRFDRILKPYQLTQYRTAAQQHQFRNIVALLDNLSPQQKMQLAKSMSVENRRLNAVITSQQQIQMYNSLETTVAQLKASKKLPSTFYLGWWQPAARINPNQPVQLEVINGTNQPLQYGLTTNAPKQLSAGEHVALNAVPLPGNVLVYPTAPEVSLKYSISTIGNTVIVQVKQVTNDDDLPNDTPGDGSIALDSTGAIYIY